MAGVVLSRIDVRFASQVWDYVCWGPKLGKLGMLGFQPNVTARATGYALPGACRWSARTRKFATCQGNVQREALKPQGLLQSHVPVATILVRLMFCCVLPYQAGRRDVGCHRIGGGAG